MVLTLVRYNYRKDGVFGILYDKDDRVLCVTLERSYKKGSNYQPKLKNGTYKCILGPHKLKGMTKSFSTYEVTGVKGHSGILFHWGNYNSDSNGCVLVGLETVSYGDIRNNNLMITHSRAAFRDLMEKLNNVKSFTLVVV